MSKEYFEPEDITLRKAAHALGMDKFCVMYFDCSGSNTGHFDAALLPKDRLKSFVNELYEFTGSEALTNDTFTEDDWEYLQEVNSDGSYISCLLKVIDLATEECLFDTY